jgi:hypothetical protein
MRLALTSTLLSLLATPLVAQAGARDTADPDRPVAGGSTLPAGWSMRTDAKGDAKNVKVVRMGEGLHVTVGPAIILYREDTRGTGPFHTLATFTQTKPGEHAEGYGLFFGGKDLQSEAQSYTYFLVRQDGSYLIKRRDGAKTSDVSKGWTAHPAVKQPQAGGSATHLLEVDNKVDPSKVTFKVNGQEVYTADAKGMNVNGVVGLRVNHNLDLHIEGFDVHR